MSINHSHLTSKGVGYFRWNQNIYFRVKLCLKKATFSEKTQEASYLVTELIAQKNEKHHALGENLIMPAYKYIVMKMLTSCSMRNWKGSILHGMISCHTDDMSHDAEELWVIN